MQVFLKQQLTNVVFDSHFSDEEIIGTATRLSPSETHTVTEMEDRDEENMLPVKRKKASKEHNESKKLKSKKKSKKPKGESTDAS
ncbi:unnamed protein product [Ilex paraguariensis]|uniref:Uncharacterized protein n=1 Tax=Ilex paraguariensis TaxID=185542 RepID=A0ABC8R9T7_9AQUA